MLALLLGLSLAATPCVAAQGTGPGFDFGLDLGIGTEFFLSDEHAYQRLTLLPHFGIGPLALGLDLDFHFRILDEGGIELRRADWVPAAAERGFLDLYLSKIAYLHWAVPGAPLHLQFGSIEDVTFGNGFLVEHYANTLFLARQRVFGLNLNLDGALVGVPFLGSQLLVGNLATFDLVGGRVYARPFSSFDSLILQQIQTGLVYVSDREAGEPAARVAGYGVDLRVPVIYSGAVALTFHADAAQLNRFVAADERAPAGGALGLDGQVAWFDWRAQFRAHAANFVPGYFGPAYDAVQVRNYLALAPPDEPATQFGWLARVGFMLGNGAGASLSLDGPFTRSASAPTVRPAHGYPHLRAAVVFPEEIIGGLSFDLVYDRSVAAADADARGWVRALLDAETANVIQARINYRLGPAVLSFLHSRLLDREADEPEISSGIEAVIRLW